MKQITSWLIGTILAFFLLLVAPIVLMATFDDINARRQIDNEIVTFIDEVRDTRTITEEMLADVNLAVNSYGMSIQLNITRYAKVVNPDPRKGDGSTYTSYVAADDFHNFATGDRIKVEGVVVGRTTARKLLQSFLGYALPNYNPIYVARVR